MANEKGGFARVWGLLSLAYPNYGKDGNASALAETMRLYQRLLDDLPLEALEQAVLRHIATSKWFPTVAELREAATALVAIPLPSAIEAWGEVIAAMAGIDSYCFADHVNVPRFANPIAARLVESMGWRALCLSENGIADRARFIESYEQLAARHERERSLPAQLQAGAQAPNQLIASVAARLTANARSLT